VRGAAPPSSTSAPGPADLRRFGDAFREAFGAGAGLLAALTTAGGTLAAFGDQRAMINAVAHLATDFEDESGAPVTGDANAITRLASAYYLAANEAARSGTTELNLPFLAMGKGGPAHLSRKLTAADFAKITNRPPARLPRARR
jgi:molecular chaperone DnaK